MSHARTFAVIAAVMLLAPTAAALLPTPATKTAAEQDALFRIINGIALVIGVVVEALLLFFLVKFHRNKKIPQDDGHRGNTKAEIAWTFAPVVVLVFIAYQSVVVMADTDVSPAALAEDVAAGEAIKVDVVGHQFVWEFRYPEGRPSFGELRVQENTLVYLNLTSEDVGHAFRVPEFGILVDTWPNRANSQHFTAPAFVESHRRNYTDAGGYIQKEDPNTYFVQCQEYCGTGHSGMRAKIVVFKAGTQTKPYGSAADAVSVCAQPLGDRQVVPVALKEQPGPNGAWSVDPAALQFAPGTKVRFEASVEGGSVHNLAVGPDTATTTQKTPDFKSPDKECMDFDMPAAATQLAFYCAVPGHASLGMRGSLTVA